MREKGIPLALLPRKLAEVTGRPVPTYRQLYARVLNGDVPAHQDSGGHWIIKPADIPVIAAKYCPGSSSKDAA